MLLAGDGRGVWRKGNGGMGSHRTGRWVGLGALLAGSVSWEKGTM